MTWADWTILTCGVAGVVLAQIPATQRYACFAGIAGQFGWFSAVSLDAQPGIWMTCVVYALAWCYGLWLHWVLPWLETLIGRGPPDTAGLTSATTTKRRKPSLRLVRGRG